MPQGNPTMKPSRAPRMIPGALGALGALLTLVVVLPAHAQSAYAVRGQTVLVDYSVLDRLGPAPMVPDGRFVLRAPRSTTLAAAPAAHRKMALRYPTPHRAATQAVTRVEQNGSVTIDYSALPAPSSERGPRLVLRRPGAQTVAADIPMTPTPAAPLGPQPRAEATVAVLSAPTPVPAPTPPRETPAPQVAVRPPSPLGRVNPVSAPEAIPTPQPLAGAALAATRPPLLPVADTGPVARSDDHALRFSAGTADLHGVAKTVLDSLAVQLKRAPQDHIQLIAYASGGADQAIEARRVSLARAVAVRAYLIQQGVASTRIDVRALGNRVEDGGSADRVDLVTTIGQ